MKFSRYFSSSARRFTAACVAIALAACLFAGLSACEQDFSGARYDSEDELQIMDYIDSREDLSTFRELMDYTGQRSLLRTAGSYTLFVPDNEAFAQLFARLGSRGQNVSRIADREPEWWINYLRYHLLVRKVNTNEFQPGPLPASTYLNGKYITADIRDSYASIRLNNMATIKEYNIELANGFVNIVDQVLDPPVESIYDNLKNSGKYSTMLSIFEETGYDVYLKDSLATVFVESDEVLEREGFDRESIEDLESWAAYHIVPDSGYFLNQLNGRRFYSLYRQEPLAFNQDEFGQYYLNERYRFDQSLEYGIDRVAMNGIYHSLDTIMHIEEAVPATIRMNLYPPGSTYGEQNVFTQAPSRILRNTGTRSYHQGQAAGIMQFDATQVGDYFYMTIPDVPAGKYRIKLIHRAGGTRGDYLTIYNGKIVKDDIVLSTVDGTFEDWDYLSYNWCGDIEVETRSDVTLNFVFTDFGSNRNPGYCCDVLMDIIELIPILE